MGHLRTGVAAGANTSCLHLPHRGLPCLHRGSSAIVSVSDKLGLAGFARGLASAGVEIYSTGGTRRHLESEGIPVRDVADYTGFPEMMGGRLKTLHPKVHGGILARRDNAEDMRSLAAHGIATFDLVVVNLYPFEATVAKEGIGKEEAIEQIDIGGPTLVRAAAKNYRVRHRGHPARAILGDPRPGGGRRRDESSSFANGWPARRSRTRPVTIGRSPLILPD